MSARRLLFYSDRLVLAVGLEIKLLPQGYDYPHNSKWFDVAKSVQAFNLN